MVVLAVCLSAIYLVRIVNPSVSTYTGQFVETHRNSRVAPPLPVTYEYIFWNGEGQKKAVYLDAFSKKKVYPCEFVKGQSYEVYFDDFSNVIVKIVTLED